MTSVAIFGAAGRMGQMMAEGLGTYADIEVRFLVDEREPAMTHGARYVRTLDELDGAVDVVVDFSTLEASRAAVTWCIEHAVPVVVGTTGRSEAELADLEAHVDAAGASVLIAANFSVGAVLAERFAEMAAPYFERVEIIELHHDKKIDAPSGTSLATARSIAAARAQAGLRALDEMTERETAPHPRGAEGPGGIRVHSVRLPGLVAHQEVIFGGPGEGLTIRHDSFDRSSFVGGVALAVRAVTTSPGLTRSIRGLL